MNNKYSLKTFTLLWVAIFIFSFAAFVYLILNLFFSEHITKSSLKDLKYSAYVSKLKLSDEREKMKDTLALHVTSPEFLGFLTSKSYEKAKALVDNWKALHDIESIEYYSLEGSLFSLESGVLAGEGVVLSKAALDELEFGYEDIDYFSKEEGLIISVQRKLYSVNREPLGYLVERKLFPYSFFMEDSQGRDLIVKNQDGVVFASLGVESAKRLSDKAFKKGAAAFELSLSGKIFDVIRLDLVRGVTFFIVKENLKEKVFKSFYRKYLLYFVVFIFFLLLMFYLSYHRQVFKPIDLISKSIQKKESSVSPEVETSIRELSLIHKKISRKISDLNEDVEQNKTGRVKDVNRLVASVAHELNNSLSYLGGNLEYLKEEFDGASKDYDEVEIRDALVSAQSGYQRIKKIVSDLRVFSSKRDLSLEWVPFLNIESKLKSELENVDFNIGESLNKYLVLTDLDRSTQIIKNLILNAQQAYKESLTPNVLVSFYKSSNRELVVSVKDWAGGIAPEAIDKIFEPFFTTKKTEGGAGLGLALSQNLASELGAELVLEETNSEGSVFSFKMKQIKLGSDV